LPDMTRTRDLDKVQKFLTQQTIETPSELDENISH
jgi:hypothetical protein